MYVRLAFSVAAHLEPEILLVDEVLAVGDAEFQRRCLGRMEDFGATGRTVLFVSHNMQAIAQLCDRAILLDERPDRRWTARARRSSPTTSRPSPGTARARRGPTSRPRPATTSCGSARCASSTRDGRDRRLRRRPRARRDRDRGSRCSRDGPAVFPKIKVVDRRATSRSTRWTRPALARAVAARATTSRRPGFPGTS